MKVRLLGTGSPVPLQERAGTSLVITADGERVLVDCGPRTVYELMRNGINPGEITDLFFTHHHIDHNAAFPHFAVTSWNAGRESLTLYGPEGTDRLLQALYSVYEEDLEYRKSVGYPPEGIEDIEWKRVDDGFETTTSGLTVRSIPVVHSIETYAYRFEDGMGDAIVFSGDTAKTDRLSDFAAGADVLVHDAHLSPLGDPPDHGFVWERYTTPYSGELKEGLSKTHSTPEEAGEIAEEAGVETLVLTHFPPYRDEAAIHDAAATTFSGEIVVGSDGVSVDTTAD